MLIVRQQVPSLCSICVLFADVYASCDCPYALFDSDERSDMDTMIVKHIPKAQ